MRGSVESIARGIGAQGKKKRTLPQIKCKLQHKRETQTNFKPDLRVSVLSMQSFQIKQNTGKINSNSTKREEELMKTHILNVRSLPTLPTLQKSIHSRGVTGDLPTS